MMKKKNLREEIQRGTGQREEAMAECWSACGDWNKATPQARTQALFGWRPALDKLSDWDEAENSGYWRGRSRGVSSATGYDPDAQRG